MTSSKGFIKTLLANVDNLCSSKLIKPKKKSHKTYVYVIFLSIKNNNSGTLTSPESSAEARKDDLPLHTTYRNQKMFNRNLMNFQKLMVFF